MRSQMLSYWWLALFALFSFSLYEQGAYKVERAIKRLDVVKNDLEASLKLKEAARDQLRREVGSQSDPAWVELTLMRRLGLVPEGYTKIYFKTPCPHVMSTSGVKES
jgi:hypothetical protein